MSDDQFPFDPLSRNTIVLPFPTGRVEERPVEAEPSEPRITEGLGSGDLPRLTAIVPSTHFPQLIDGGIDAGAMRTAWSTASLDPTTVLRRKLSEQRLESEQLRLLGTAVHVSAEGILIMTPAVEEQGPRISFVNDGFLSMTGRTRDEVIGQTPEILGITRAHEPVYISLLQHVFSGRPFEGEASARRKDGTEFELDIQLVPVDDSGELTHWVAFVRDVTERRHQMVQLRHQALHDGLTELPNRTLLFDRLDHAIRAAQRSREMVALLLMDLDRFKEVNDTFGHQFGDALLKDVALRLRGQMRSSDTVARLGGDEFAVVLPGINDASAVASLARKILRTLEQPFIVDGQALEVGASIGIALYPTHGADARTLLRRADIAMYSAKQSNAGFTFHRADQESVGSPDQMSLIVEMRNALDLDQFVLHYQPKLHLRSGLVTRVEVLIRWNHPQRGLIGPEQFVPLAERTGLIKPISDWVLDHALQQASEWHAQGAPVHLAVNLSAKSLQEPSLPSKILALLEKWRVEPRFLKLEITESSILADPEHALAILWLLQGMGVRLSLDDFGTGYSSLTHLRQLPVDEIKIDKSFVLEMMGNNADAAIVRTVIDLAHNLGKQVCAEGVENEATWAKLRELGCDLAQGYWISRPLPAPQLMQWLMDSCWGLKLRR
jgi:diguanylate cyclase (GGDEF)-like protein/PAS domain S-box-containing protein